MLDFRQKLFLSTAMTLSLCYTAALAEETAGAAQPSTAPVPGNAPLHLMQPATSQGSAVGKEEEEALLPKESDEAIKKANELHAQAAEQLKKDNIEQAIKLDEEAMKAAPHYWLPHVALAYLYSYYKGGGPALEQAAMGVKCEHPAMAENTHAALIGSLHAFASAMERYKKLAAEDPTSWRAKVGLAACYMNKGDAKSANAILDELNNAGVKEPPALLMMGNYYKKTGEPEKAKEVLKRGLANNPDPKIKDKLLIQLFEIAVNTDDAALITELKPKVSPILDARQRSWLRTGDIKLAKTPAEAKLALQLAETETITDAEYRSYARIFDAMAKANPSEQSAWLKLSQEALTQALTLKPAELQNKALLAATDEKLGDKKQALKIIHTPSPLTQAEAEQDVYLSNYYRKARKAQDDALAKLFVADKDGYKCFAQAIDFKIPMANCKCKVNSASSMIKGIPGVFDVIVGAGEMPTATVVFDKKKLSGPAIFQDPKIKNFKEKLEVSNERPVNNITELAQIYGNQEQYPIAQSPPVQLVSLQYPSVEDAVTAVSVGSNSHTN